MLLWRMAFEKLGKLGVQRGARVETIPSVNMARVGTDDAVAIVKPELLVKNMGTL